MKWPLKLFIAAVLLTAAAVAATLVPKFRNMKSEYRTAEAIHDLETFVLEHDGRWPSSSAELGDKYPAGGDVLVDYTMTSSRLIGHRSLLREAVRPRSGKFLTYPHHEENLDRLYAALLKANARRMSDQPRPTRFFSNHFGPISEPDVEKLEELLPLPLPDSYRRFLLVENGGVASNPKEHDSMVLMFGIYDGPNDLSLHWDETRESLPATMLPIGENGNQDLLTLDLRDGTIHLAGKRIASDFRKWIQDTIIPFESTQRPAELITDGRFDELDALLKSGQLDINSEAIPGMSLIQYSAWLREAEAVEFLAQRGASPSGALHAMLKSGTGHLQIIKCLLKHGADIHERDSEGRRVIDIDSPWTKHIVKQAGAENP